MTSLNENKSGATSPKTVNKNKYQDWDVWEYDQSDNPKQQLNELGITLYFNIDIDKLTALEIADNLLKGEQWSADMWTLAYKEDE